MAQAGSGWELQANFQLCSLLGTLGALVIYGPCQVEGGGKRGRAWPGVEVGKLPRRGTAAFLSLRETSGEDHWGFGFIWDAGFSTPPHHGEGLGGASPRGDCREPRRAELGLPSQV